MSNATCTFGPDAISGERCGKPAVASFRGSDGQMYHECREHHVPIPVRDTRRQEGDPAKVRRYGRIYTGTIVRITPTKYHVRFTYDNGAERTVPVDWQEFEELN
jgi:hypothetical protein